MSGGHCSFCGKGAHEVFRIIAGSSCMICSECVGICSNMIAAEYRKVAEPLLFPPRDEKEPGA